MFLSVTVQQNRSAHLLSKNVIKEEKKVHRLIAINTHLLLNCFQVIRDTWLLQSILQLTPVRELRKQPKNSSHIRLPVFCGFFFFHDPSPVELSYIIEG